jgi:hypothetical protein
MVVFGAGWLDVECSFAAPVALVGFPTDVEGGTGMDSAKKSLVVTVAMAERRCLVAMEDVVGLF